MSKTDFVSYANDNVTSLSVDSIDDVMKSLKDDSINFLKLFLENQMKTNSSKCHIITNIQSSINL